MRLARWAEAVLHRAGTEGAVRERVTRAISQQTVKRSRELQAQSSKARKGEGKGI